MTAPLVHGVLRLQDAVLCLDDACETIFHLVDARCPRCGSEHFALLAAWLRERAAA